MSHGDDNTGQFTDEEVSDEAITFGKLYILLFQTKKHFYMIVLAGHETTSTLMTWTLYNLVNNPDVYQRCQAEVDSVLNGDDDDEITPSTISLLTYTEAVLKESLRFHQPVPILRRTAIEDNTLVARDGKQIHIRKGTDIAMNLIILIFSSYI
jgi:cytochrome P450